MSWKNLFGEEGTAVAEKMQPPAPVKVHIRWMIRRDVEEVLAIEAASFDCPWLEKDLIRCLRQRNCIGMVAEHENRVAGYMVYELDRKRIRLLNLAVAVDLRGRGVGSQMIAKLKAKLTEKRRNRITLKIRESNLTGQIFFRGLGFRAIKILKAFYDTGETAYEMEFWNHSDAKCKGK